MFCLSQAQCPRLIAGRGRSKGYMPMEIVLRQVVGENKLPQITSGGRRTILRARVRPHREAAAANRRHGGSEDHGGSYKSALPGGQEAATVMQTSRFASASQITCQNQVAVREMMSPKTSRVADQTKAEVKFANWKRP